MAIEIKRTETCPACSGAGTNVRGKTIGELSEACHCCDGHGKVGEDKAQHQQKYQLR